MNEIVQGSTVEKPELNWREKRVLEALKEHGPLRYCDLPYMIGRSTMERMVERGLVKVATPRIGQYAKGFKWALK